MNRKVLLIEPNYKNKFPPIGLMKLATYFKMRGDDVVFYKGDLKEFVIRDITEQCIEKFTSLDDQINWKLRADKISRYIKSRNRRDLDSVGIDESQFSILIYPWMDFYKKQFWRGDWKKNPRWDWVGVTTLFTFYWDITIETINYAKYLVKDTNNLMVGGVLASIQPEEIEKATGIKPHQGVLGKHDVDSDNELVIDELPLDYSILDEIDYEYPDHNAYYSYSTRGCIRHCPFCAVPILEPHYSDYLPLHDRIMEISKRFGEQQNLLLMDNNVLASKKLPEIIEDIKSCGFTKDSKYFEPDYYSIAIRNLQDGINDRAYIRKCFKLLKALNESKWLNDNEREEVYSLRSKYGLLHPDTCTKKAIIDSNNDFKHFFEFGKSRKRVPGRRRCVDFNQGVDARLFDEEKVKLLSQIPISPLRIAFDNIQNEKEYVNAITLSVNKGMRDFSNYLLYNFKDKPIDLYRRLRINVDLCEKLDVSIYSFPMKYHPIRGEHSHDRDFIGDYWNRKYIRAVQAILNATKGKIGRGVSFFEKAFGSNEEEFMELLIMPETFIIFRLFFEHLGYTQAWRESYRNLSGNEKAEIQPIIFKNDFNHIDELTNNPRLLDVLKYYKNYRAEIADHDSELFKLKLGFETSKKGK